MVQEKIGSGINRVDLQRSKKMTYYSDLVEQVKGERTACTVVGEGGVSKVCHSLDQCPLSASVLTSPNLQTQGG